MVRFAIIGHVARTSSDFSLTDLPGGAGRMDLLCRCVSASLFLSHGIRKHALCYLILLGEPDAPKTILIDGGRVHHLSPDERNIASHIQKALAIPCGLIFRELVPGIAVRRGGLKEILGEHRFCVLDEKGRDIRGEGTLAGCENFLLSDHGNFTPDEAEAIAGAACISISLGPRVLHADHAIVLVHNERDRAEVLFHL